MHDIILVQNLNHNYGEKPALKDFSLSVSTGQLHGLIGPDSAGKTTLMRILCGLLPIQTGEGEVLGLNLKTDYKAIRAQLGYMPQRFSLYQDLSVQENLMFFARLFSVPASERDKRMPELYAFSRLEAFKTRKAGALSGGMKQKLALSCALIHRPELLLLDEPTYGVDPVSRQEFWQMLKSIQKEGTSILVSTPYMEEAELCDKVSLMLNGKLMVSDTPSDIISKWDKNVYRLTSSNLKEMENKLCSFEGIESCQLFGHELHLIMDKTTAEDTVKALQSKFGHTGFTVEKVKPSMEDIYLSYMQSSAIKEQFNA